MSEPIGYIPDVGLKTLTDEKKFCVVNATKFDDTDIPVYTKPKDNLTLIRERYQDKFGKIYADNTGQIFMFVGIVIAEDDYYYGLMNMYDKKWTLSSCVGYLEESGYEEVVK